MTSFQPRPRRTQEAPPASLVADVLKEGQWSVSFSSVPTAARGLPGSGVAKLTSPGPSFPPARAMPRATMTFRRVTLAASVSTPLNTGSPPGSQRDGRGRLPGDVIRARGTERAHAVPSRTAGTTERGPGEGGEGTAPSDRRQLCALSTESETRVQIAAPARPHGTKGPPRAGVPPPSWGSPRARVRREPGSPPRAGVSHEPGSPPSRGPRRPLTTASATRPTAPAGR